MLGTLSSSEESRHSTVDETHVPTDKIDVSRYLDEMERVLRYGSDVGMRNEALAILRRWQFDAMLTSGSSTRAMKLLREFSEFAQPHKVVP